MKTYTLPSTQISLDDSWDVIVLGGGPAGCASAAAAGMEGARTLLIEATGSLGGMGTSALVPAWTPFSDKQKIIYCGIAEKVFNECKAGMPHVKSTDLDWVPIDPERLKRVYDKLVTDAGVKVLFNTHLAQVDAKDGEIQVITVVNKSGLTAYKAKVFVDCTGDADLSAWAGAEFHQGNEKGEKLMPATHCFVLTNVDEYAYRTSPTMHPGNSKSIIYDIVKSGKYPEIPDTHLCDNIIGPGTVGFNAGHIWNVDNTKPETVSSAMIEGRKMADAYRRALAEYNPRAFGNSFLVMTGSLLGIRETRRIVGDYVLTLADYVERRSFDDEICRNSYFIDVHWAKEEFNNKPENFFKWEKEKCFHYGPGESHGIPYRCLTPKKLKNVLVAGRSISCEQLVQGSVRVMPVCLAMGHAAGTAAAMAAKKDANVHKVSVPELRQKLIKGGAYLPDPVEAQSALAEPAMA